MGCKNAQVLSFFGVHPSRACLAKPIDASLEMNRCNLVLENSTSAANLWPDIRWRFDLED
jgi:hypothetical protein